MSVELIDVAEAAKRLSISRSHFYHLLSQGLFGPAAHRLGGSVRFSPLEISEWIAAGSPTRQQWEIIKQRAGMAVER